MRLTRSLSRQWISEACRRSAEPMPLLPSRFASLPRTLFFPLPFCFSAVGANTRMGLADRQCGEFQSELRLMMLLVNSIVPLTRR